MTHTLLVVPYLTLVFGSSFVLAGCGQQQADARQLPPLVRVAQVAVPPSSERAFTGVVAARVVSDLGFRVSGKITERLVDDGQAVKRGQVLMRIDNADLRLASAGRAAAVEAARSRALQTAADEQRYRGLVEKGAISAMAYEQSKSAAIAAAAELKTVEAQADFAVNEARYSVLQADSDGIVIETLSEPGQVVSAGQIVVRLAHAGPREARIDLPETLRPLVGSGAKVRVYGEDGPSGDAKLRQLSQSANPISRTYEARYVLNGAAAAAPLGSTITVLVPNSARIASVEIPLSALTDKGDGPGVWILETPAGGEALVAWRAVKVSSLSEESAAVIDGLHIGDRFVAMGAHMLNSGDRVRLSSADQAVSASGIVP